MLCRQNDLAWFLVIGYTYGERWEPCKGSRPDFRTNAANRSLADKARLSLQG
jgi:hypothetical protein